MSEKIKTHANSFDFVRLLAASMVIYAHSFNLRGADAHEPFQMLTRSAIGFGELAVLIFFAISGYLVTQSWMRDPNIGRFLRRRLLRLIPALAVVTLFAAFILGPWLTTISLNDYFANHETWKYLLNIFMYPVHYNLPGVFADNPYPNAVNGSIWTLRLEFSLYLVVVALGVMRLMRWRWTGLAMALACVTGAYALRHLDVLQNIPFHRELLLIAINGIPFFIGLYMARNLGIEQSSPPMIVVAGLASAVFACIPGMDLVAILLLGYFVVTFAHRFKADFGCFGDYSYGLYVWAFVVQQTLMHFDPTLRSTPFFLMAFAGTFVFAVLSWHFVEQPALKLKPSAHR